MSDVFSAEHAVGIVLGYLAVVAAICMHFKGLSAQHSGYNMHMSGRTVLRYKGPSCSNVCKSH